MRLLTVTHYFESHRGGVELVAGRLAREFAALGVETTWLASDASPPPSQGPGLRPVPVRALNLTERLLGIPFPIPLPSAIARILRAVREADAVLLHDALYPSNVVAFLAARAARRPVMVIQHIGEVPYRNPALRALMGIANALVARPLLARADQVAFISQVTAGYFEGVRFRRAPAVVFNGVDTELFRPADAPAKAAARAGFGLPADGPVALFVGRFVEKKGLPFIEAAARRRPDVTFALAGWGPIDPAAWGLPNVTVFAGLAHPALAELYRAADALVLPSAGEGFPLVVQEALASGLAVICGTETVEADPAAAPFLHGVPESGEPAVVAEAILAGLDGIGSDNRAAERAAFARGRYAWDRAARRHLELLDALVAPAEEPAPLTALRNVAS